MQMNYRILDRYITKEILSTWVAVMTVLLLVMMSAEVARQLSWLAEGRIQSAMLLPLMFNSLLRNTVLLMPLSCLLSVLLGFGRLYKDSEMAAIMSAGVGPAGWYRPVWMIALPASMFLLMMTLFVVPELDFRKAKLLDEARSQNDLSSMMVGQFNPADSSNAVFFVESQSEAGGRSNGIFFRQESGGLESLDLATSASSRRDENGREYLVMYNGRQYIGTPGQADYRIVEYEEYGIRLAMSQSDTKRSLRAMSSSALLAADLPEHQAELHWRITIPIAMFMLALLAVPLSHTGPRSGRYAKLAAALVIYLVYANLLGISKKWIADETIPLWLGSWWVHALVVVIILLLLWQQGLISRQRQREVGA